MNKDYEFDELKWKKQVLNCLIKKHTMQLIKNIKKDMKLLGIEVHDNGFDN